jgi:hypothetical protein
MQINLGTKRNNSIRTFSYFFGSRYVNMSKADISVHGLVLVVLLVLFIFAAFVIFYSWVTINNAQASTELCSVKLLNYCTDWYSKGFKDVPYDWSSKPPTGCEASPINIKQPANPVDCKSLLGIK